MLPNPPGEQWPQPATAGPAPPGGPDGRTAQAPTLLWLRGGDLRLHDNEALAAAIKGASCLLPAYVFDPREYGQVRCGAVWCLMTALHACLPPPLEGLACLVGVMAAAGWAAHHQPSEQHDILTVMI